MNSISLLGFIKDSIACLYRIYYICIGRKIKRNKLHIVTFHRILPDKYLKDYPLKNLVSTTDEFDWLLNQLKSYFEIVDFDELFIKKAGHNKSKPSLTITFDDGMFDNYVYAAPILERHNVKGTFFIPIEAIESRELLWHDKMAYQIKEMGERKEGLSFLKELGIDYSIATINPKIGVQMAKTWTAEKRESWIETVSNKISFFQPDWDGMMSWQHIRELSKQGHKIGCHSYTHPILTNCNDTQLYKEINFAKQSLEQNIECEVDSFCYPNGNTNSRVISFIKKAEYQYAVSTNCGVNLHNRKIYQLNRFDINPSNLKNRHGQLSSAKLLMRMSLINKERLKWG